MKPAPFAYRAPDSIEQAVGALAEGDAAILAGGQSLLLQLRYRERRPARVVDINRIPGLAGIGLSGGSVRLGALVRHAQLERAGFDDPLASLMREIARHVGHPPIRARGTFAGSVAWAHPAAEWNALLACLDGAVLLRGPSGEREVPAAAWFRGPFRTARRPDELVTGARLPLLGHGTAVRFAELRRTHGSFAQVAVIVAVRVSGGRIDSARIGLAGAAGVPLRATAAEAVLTGAEPSAESARAAAEAAATEADPVSEPHCSAAYRRHAIGVLVRRSLLAATGVPR